MRPGRAPTSGRSAGWLVGRQDAAHTKAPSTRTPVVKELLARRQRRRQRQKAALPVEFNRVQVIVVHCAIATTTEEGGQSPFRRPLHLLLFALAFSPVAYLASLCVCVSLWDSNIIARVALLCTVRVVVVR